MTVVQTKKHAFDGFGPLFELDDVPAAAFLHVVFEQVAMQHATVHQRDRLLFLHGAVPVVVARHKMPALAGDKRVDAGHRTVPVFSAIHGATDAFSTLEPVHGTEEGPQTEEEVWRHGFLVSPVLVEREVGRLNEKQNTLNC